MMKVDLHTGRVTTLHVVRWALLGLILALTASTPASAQNPRPWHTDSLRLSAGPTWHRVQSLHFEVYSEYRGDKAQDLVDSLEAAWVHARKLLGSSGPDTTPIIVFITASRTRFARVMMPTNKGMMGRSLDGHDLIAIVHNDSVRAYTRHEVMHALASRAWGPGSMHHGAWLAEGLATFADGTCLGLPLSVVARDLLRSKPSFTSNELQSEFTELQARSRGAAYVLAGSLVDYLWSARGRKGVMRLWTGEDSLAPSLNLRTGFGLTQSLPDIDREWRKYVERTAGSRPGIDMSALERHGCG